MSFLPSLKQWSSQKFALGHMFGKSRPLKLDGSENNKQKLNSIKQSWFGDAKALLHPIRLRYWL
jgi:hypothetical protein